MCPLGMFQELAFFLDSVANHHFVPSVPVCVIISLARAIAHSSIKQATLQHRSSQVLSSDSIAIIFALLHIREIVRRYFNLEVAIERSELRFVVPN